MSASDKPGKAERFVLSTIERCQQNKGLSARLRRADNPATEDQSWEFLIAFGIDLEKKYERLPFATIACAIARAKAERNGSLPLGRALANCCENGSDGDSPGKARLRRLLACDSLDELCRILRPLLSLILSKSPHSLNYVLLLEQLQRFAYGADSARRVKAEWAQSFYRKAHISDEQDANQEGK
ncbi:type I-E CRISPR-associated protein Cse2/CasB [Alphaproteobacteria bacterium]|nr:type I-E CRISPR-associated protein Cse2/CasB [Alphaproteobacteria bacterium]